MKEEKSGVYTGIGACKCPLTISVTMSLEDNAVVVAHTGEKCTAANQEHTCKCGGHGGESHTCQCGGSCGCHK